MVVASARRADQVEPRRSSCHRCPRQNAGATARPSITSLINLAAERAWARCRGVIQSPPSAEVSHRRADEGTTPRMSAPVLLRT